MASRGSRGGGVRRESAEAHQEVEGRLEHIHDVAEIVIGDEAVVSHAARHEKVDQLVCRSKSELAYVN